MPLFRTAVKCHWSIKQEKCESVFYTKENERKSLRIMGSHKAPLSAESACFHEYNLPYKPELKSELGRYNLWRGLWDLGAEGWS